MNKIAAFPSLPSRRELRQGLAYHCRPNSLLALSWWAFDLLTWSLITAATAGGLGWGWKLLAGVASGVWIARLFVIGHDACHHALTSHRRLNRLLGRVAFLPSLTPYSHWEVGHNLAHHGFTNLRGRDSVWVPLSPPEFKELPRHRQLLERFYRSGFGPGLYYLVEVWWKKLYFPRADQGGGQRAVFAQDCWLVSCFALTWIGALYLLAEQAGSSPLEAVLFGWLVPLCVWNCLMGFIIYIHHTEPDVAWYVDGPEWGATRPHLGFTLHLQAPFLDALFHRILQHPAHHLDTAIPFYRLRAAQQSLQAMAPAMVQVRRLNWHYYWSVVRQCKLYDYNIRKWQTFS